MMACRWVSTLIDLWVQGSRDDCRVSNTGSVVHTAPVISLLHCRDHLLQQVVGGLVLVAKVPAVLLDIHDLTLVLLAALCASLYGKRSVI